MYFVILVLIKMGKRGTLSKGNAGGCFVDYRLRHLACIESFSSTVLLKEFMRCFTSFSWLKGSN